MKTDRIDFDALIDNHIRRESKPKSIGRYYPSEIGSCIRKVWYTYNYPMEVRPELRRVFELGDILHDFIVEVLKSEKTATDIELLEAEMPFKLPFNDFVISGRIDDLLLLKAGGKKVLVEVKSCKNVRMIKSPMPHHKIQLQFYMYATQVHDGVLLYVDKSTLQTRSFSVMFSPKQAKRILNKFRALHKHLTNGGLPAAEAKKQKETKWMCNYCEYREKCIKDEK
jgi:CRISPR/Cas system-associated exonuclease Cas4 (RecB family)